MRNIKSTPIPVQRALKKLGRDLRDARKRRRIPMALAADRAAMSRATLTKIERGDEGVSLSAYARILFILGMLQRLVELADPTFDALGLDMETERLPQRIRFPRAKREEN